MRQLLAFSPRSSSAFAAFVAPARRAAALWLLPLGAILTGVVYMLWIAAMIAAIGLANGRGWDAERPFSDLRSPADMAGMLLTFGGAILGVALSVRLLHGRAARTLLAPDGARIGTWSGRTLLGFALVHAPLLALAGLSGALTLNRPVTTWLAVLPFALAAVLVQTLAEELLFRGYLMQQLAARYRSALVWMVLPSAAFAALHLANGEGSGMQAIWAFAFGLAAADLTARTGTLTAAWMFHAANNGRVMLLVGDDNLSGLALWSVAGGGEGATAGMTVGALMVQLALLLVTWLAVRIALRR